MVTPDPSGASPAPSDIEEQSQRTSRRIIRNLLVIAVAGVGFYFVGPKVADVFSSFPKLTTVNPAWLVVIGACEVLSFIMTWEMLRIALHTKQWGPIATAQLSGNAFSSIVPGGAPAGAALQVRMLSQVGIDTTRAAAGMTVFTLLQFASLTALPVLALPTIIGGAAVPPGLQYSAIVGAIAFLVIVGVGAALAALDGPLRGAGRALQWVDNRLHQDRAPVRDLPARLITQRNQTRHMLGEKWRPALVVTMARIAFDYLALLASLAAVGADVRPSLVLLAYSAAVVLALIPITPGGLGFVEAGLTGLLTLAGASAGDAVFATLIYRLASYWLPLLAGPVAYVVFRVRHREAT